MTRLGAQGNFRRVAPQCFWSLGIFPWAHAQDDKGRVHKPERATPWPTIFTDLKTIHKVLISTTSPIPTHGLIRRNETP